jgi:hypothetical protein
LGLWLSLEPNQTELTAKKQTAGRLPGPVANTSHILKLVVKAFLWGDDRETSAKNISVWVEWLRQSGRALSELSETPRWQITPRPAPIPGVALHMPLRSQFRRFLLLCWYAVVNEHGGVVANCNHCLE